MKNDKKPKKKLNRKQPRKIVNRSKPNGRVRQRREVGGRNKDGASTRERVQGARRTPGSRAKDAVAIEETDLTVAPQPAIIQQVAVARQVIMPNPNIRCTPGWCLVYVRETFGIGPKYPSAITNWAASQHKHTDQNFPTDLWVPIWFSLSDNPHGHVALRQPDGTIWSSSSPEGLTPVHHPSLENIISYYGNRLTYLGWTEDVEDVMVVNLSAGAPVIDAPPLIPLIATVPGAK